MSDLQFAEGAAVRQAACFRDNSEKNQPKKKKLMENKPVPLIHKMALNLLGD